MIPERFANACLELTETVKRKNADYAQGGSDPWFNFTMVEKLGVTDTKRGMLVRMCDKYARIVSLLDREAQVKDETVKDTLLDLAAYAILMSLYIEDQGDGDAGSRSGEGEGSSPIPPMPGNVRPKSYDPSY